LGRVRVAETALERTRKRWRVLYEVYQMTADQFGREVRADKVASDQEIDLEAVRGIVADFHRAGLLDLSPGLASDDLEMSITPTGRQVVLSASLDADPTEMADAPGLPQMENDARRVLRVLAEYARMEDDPDRGHHDLDEIDLQGLTNLPTRRLNDAVDLLTRKGYLSGERELRGQSLNWHGKLNDLGRHEYQRLRIPSDQPPPAVSGMQPTLIINARDIIHSPFQQGGQGNAQTVSYTAPDSQALAAVLEEILDLLPELNLAPDDQASVSTEAAVVRVHLTSRQPRMGAVRESAEIILRILEGAAGSAVATGAMAAAPLAGELAHRLALLIPR
jgi:hypothetical protein